MEKRMSAFGLLPEREFAEHVGIPVQTLRNRRSLKKPMFPSCKIDGRVYYDLEAVREFIAAKLKNSA